MKIEELQAKMRTLHQEAARVNAALERKEQAELREKLKAQRKEQSPLSDEEIKEGSNSKRKSIEEIIESGTPEERAALIISDHDLKRTYGIKGVLSEADKKRLQANLNKRPQEERNVFLFYAKEYDRLNRFYPRLHNYIKAYQAEVGLLATLIAKWEAYDREAEICNKLYRSFIDKQPFKAPDGRTISPTEAEEFALCYRNNLLEVHSDWKEATLLFDEATNTFRADIDGECKLYEKIKKQAEDTRKSLSQLKTAIKVAEDYIFDEVAYFVEPAQMENSIEMVETECYARSYGGPLRYFRSELNARKDKGETITPEDEKRAVIPDFYEVELNAKTLDFIKDYLLNIM